MINKPIIITPGEPSGIGPDIVIKLIQKNWSVPIVICASIKLLVERAKKLKLPLNLITYNPKDIIIQSSGRVNVLPIETIRPVIPGILCSENSYYVVKTLDRACNGCLNKEFSAIITGPVHKGIINEAGLSFTGHTEFFAKKSKCNVVMMLISKKMKIAVATTHVALKKVPYLIKRKKLYTIIKIIHNDLINNFGIVNPHIFVCGLNPHAGEDGYIGTEEKKIIIPALTYLKSKGIRITGPLPADTLFQKKYLKKADAILTMYHDQGFPVIKFHGFGKIVNITLGLPFIRTSVDHGTALELAGTKKSKYGSLSEALSLTIRMLNKL